MAKKRITPEERAQWQETRRQLAAAIARSEERLRTIRDSRERRRTRLRRLTFGLLGR